jgi:hypothetical protein
MRAVLVVALALAFAAFTYLRLERTGTRGWLPLACRALAWSALGLLLLNVSCPVAGPPARPLVLLDASLSMSAAGGRWADARDSARRWGEVRQFGDERPGEDTAASHGRSLLAPALLAAGASDRPVIVVTDGEIEDANELPADVVARAGVRIFPRAVRPDVAITRVVGPTRVTSGDSIPLEVEVAAVGGDPPDSVVVQAAAGKTRLATRTVRLRGGSGRTRLAVASAAVGTGEQVLRISLARWSDAEPRTDARLHLVTIAPTPGVVLLAGAADWDGRFLYRTLREVAQLPVRGFVRLDPDHWRSMADLAVVPAAQVRQAARHADLLIRKGAAGSLAEGTTARGIWSWPAAENRQAQMAGDWYLVASEGSPVAGAFVRQPVDSFPPAIQLTSMETAPDDWVALYAQLGRHGARRPAVFGRQEARVRHVFVAVDGLWRWAFRGGSSEQSYRAWVASTASWLLGGADSARGAARPVRAVVSNGRPVIFEWIASGTPEPLGVGWSGTSPTRTDTLRFDGAGRATVWLPPAEYHYRLASGGSGIVAVEEYSDELLPRPVAIAAHQARAGHSAGRSAARDWLWLFGLCVLGLAGEWVGRRRLGLR